MPPAPPDPLRLLPPAPDAPPSPAALSAEDLLATVLDGAVARPARELLGGTLDALVVAYGVGVDHVAGERLLAWVPDAPPAEAPGALITSSRCLVLTPQRLLNLRYELIEGASVEVSVQGPAATVRRRGATLRWSAPTSAPVVVALLRALTKVAPEQRLDLQPLPGGGEDGAEAPPAGPLPPAEVEAARAQMRCMDERIDLLLRLLAAPPSQRALSPAAARCALAGVALLERTQFGGRGQRQGEWLSSLLPLELASVLVGVLGDGDATVDRLGVVRIRWTQPARAGALPAALRAAWEDLAARWGPRFGWPPPTGPLRIEAALSPAPWGSSLSLLASRGTAGLRPLGQHAPDQLALVLAWLRDLEPEHLLQRVLLGADAGPLDPARRGQLAATAEGWLGRADLEPFFTPAAAAPERDHSNPAATLPVRQPLPRPARLPPVIAASIPVLRQRAALVQIAAGFVNLVWVGLLRSVLAGLGAGEGLLSQVLGSVAVLPLALYALAIVEIGAGVLVLQQRGLRPGPTWEVALLQILSLPLGGLPSFLAGLAARGLVRRTRFTEAGAPPAPDPRAEHRAEDLEPAEQTWGWTATGHEDPPGDPQEDPPAAPDPAGERTETGPLPRRR